MLERTRELGFRGLASRSWKRAYFRMAVGDPTDLTHTVSSYIRFVLMIAPNESRCSSIGVCARFCKAIAVYTYIRSFLKTKPCPHGYLCAWKMLRFGSRSRLIVSIDIQKWRLGYILRSTRTVLFHTAKHDNMVTDSRTLGSVP